MTEKERKIRLVCFLVFSAIVICAGLYLIAGKIKQNEQVKATYTPTIMKTNVSGRVGWELNAYNKLPALLRTADHTQKGVK